MPESSKPERLSRSETETAAVPDFSERVASFRRRRDAEKGGRERTLQFDFDLQAQEKPTNLAAHSPSAPRIGEAAAQHALDKAFEEHEAREAERRPALPRGRLEPELARIPRNVPGNLGEMSRSQPAPIEFMDAGFTVSNRVEDADEWEIIAAPIRKRFLAGLIDTVVLLLAACLFVVFFSLVGGNLQSTPVDLVIAAWMISFWIFAYFASFSAVALSTPGQAAMGLAVRNLEGDLPTRQESLLRAFGYLVSIGSLMLGFLWAAMDSDGLAWHDHISGTFLTEA